MAQRVIKKWEPFKKPKISYGVTKIRQWKNFSSILSTLFAMCASGYFGEVH